MVLYCTMRNDPANLSRREFLAASAALGVGALPIGALAADPLLARPIPHGGESLPVVGIGTAIVFDIGGDAAKRAERTAVIRTMIDGGARLIDTAPSYGTAEDVVGDLLAAMNVRDRIFLATKVRVAGRDETLAEMNRSLERLKTPKVDLMQIHNVRDPNAGLDVLRAWRDQGRTRYIGITNSNPASYAALAEVVKREKPDFLQVSYSLAERQAEERLLPTARDAGTAVLTALPFGRGKLFSAVRGKALPGWAAEIGATSWAQVFLKYLLANEAVNCVIPGTDKAEYMTDNMNAARSRLPDAGMRKQILAYWEALA